VALGGLSLSSAVLAGALAVLAVAVRVSRRGPTVERAVGSLPDDLSAPRVVTTG
jgi:hypothetical protein